MSNEAEDRRRRDLAAETRDIRYTQRPATIRYEEQAHRAPAPQRVPASAIPDRLFNRFRAIRIEGAASGPIKHFSIGTEDIIAIGCVVLCFGAVVVSAIVAIGWAMGKIEGTSASKAIIACVGGGAIAGVAAAVSKKKAKHSKK